MRLVRAMRLMVGVIAKISLGKHCQSIAVKLVCNNTWITKKKIKIDGDESK